MMQLPIIAVVTQPTRLAGLKSRWATSQAALFRLQYAAGQEVERRRKSSSRSPTGVAEFDEQQAQQAAAALAEQTDYLDEDRKYAHAVEQLLDELELGFPVKTIDRDFLPNFDFGRCVLAVAIGRDGLVANCAKYVGELPIVGVNPDPQRNDGVLLPFRVGGVRPIVQQVLKERAKIKAVTLAEVNTNDGQRMLAFNDFFIGAKSHVSARYTLEFGQRIESQSSSGVLVSTGAGSSGWLSSVFNMVRAIQSSHGRGQVDSIKLSPTDRQLFWTVREPFVSRHSSAELVCGFLNESQELVVGSQMPSGGVIFSDGIEADSIQFDSGLIARVSMSHQKANLVVA